MPKSQDQGKFTSPNDSPVPFSEASLYIFLKSPQTGGLPPDCSKCCHGEYSFRGYQGPPGPPGPPGIPGKDERDALFVASLTGSCAKTGARANRNHLVSLVCDPKGVCGKSKREFGRGLGLQSQLGATMYQKLNGI